MVLSGQLLSTYLQQEVSDMQLRFVEREVDAVEPCGISHSKTIKVLQYRYPIMQKATTGVISNEAFISGYSSWTDIPVTDETHEDD